MTEHRPTPRATAPPPGAATTRSRSAWRELRALVWQQRRPLGLGAGLVAIDRLAALAVPAGSKLVIDEVIGRQRTDLLAPIALGTGAAVAVQVASAFALSQVVGVAAQRAITTLRQEVQAHVLRLPIGVFDDAHSGSFASRIMTDVEQLRLVIGPGLVQLGSDLLTAALALAVLFRLDATLTAVVLVLLLTYTAGMTRAFAWFRAAYRDVGRLHAELMGRLAERLGGIRVIRSYGAERQESKAFVQGTHRLLRATLRATAGASAVNAATILATGGVGVLLLVVGGHAVAAGTMTLGDLTMYVVLVGMLTNPLLQVAATGSEMTKALAALDRLRELRTLATEDDEDRAREPLSGIEGTVELRDVTYAYAPGGPAVLCGVGFRAPAGSTIAVVGASGEGKTTICELLLALREPTGGRIEIDGRDLVALRRRDYRRFVAVVPQDPSLFDGTIAENIAFGRPGVSETAVRDAGRLARCDEFVSRLPDRYETMVGERGLKLSGGQRQRVAIARAIVGDPRILILDEATSQLDRANEVLVRDALRALRRGRTTIVIAHRLSTVRVADLILVLEGGRIVERGTHEELIAESGRYRRLCETHTLPAPPPGMRACAMATPPSSDLRGCR